MATHRAALSLVALTLCLAMGSKFVQVCADSGQATFYTEYTLTACYGGDTSPFPAGNLIAAASPGIYNSGGACGQYYTITCTGSLDGGSYPCTSNPTVTVMVVDLCPGCPEPGFDLSQEAFSQIADLSAGRISINY